MVGPTQQIDSVGPSFTGLPSPGAAQPEPAAPPPATREPPNREQLSEAVESINKVMREANGRLDFDLYEGTDQLFVRVVDRQTNEVIRTMPPEEVLELRQKIDAAVGTIVDELV